MEMRLRKINQVFDLENGLPFDPATLYNRNTELETLVTSLKQMLDISRHREKRLVKALKEIDNGVSLNTFDFEHLDGDVDGQMFDKSTFVQNLMNRSGWLIGLLVFQSCSSFILSANEHLLQSHPSIVYFLTMLVGAGGNAGNQATVRVIREIAVSSFDVRSRRNFVLREVLMACALSVIVGVLGFLRVLLLSSGASLAETIAITIALMAIVLISVILGATMPFLFQKAGLDPANSSTSIQVVMDILGVLITCWVATALLNTSYGLNLLRIISVI